MSQVLFSLFVEDLLLAKKVSEQLRVELGLVELHKFPDEETLVRIKTSVKDKEVILVCSLVHPDTKLIPLLFFAKTAKDLGAKKITLVAPYLAYMRQDKQFCSDEGISSIYFAELISRNFDALVTVDPHLHRYKSLSEIYTIPAVSLSSAPAIANWLLKHVAKTFIIGPDVESEQWVSQIAARINAPYVILQKMRFGDQKVSISLPQFKAEDSTSLVLLDDIISSGKTMLEAIKACHVISQAKIICIGVHAVFAGSAYPDLLAAGAELITTNAVQHPSNQIDLSPIIAEALRS